MTTTEPAGRGMLRTLVLACGILSSVLYVTTDLLGGLTYEGYSFSAQTISELGAIGSPSKPLVDPLFLTYDVLLVVFGIGVMRESAARNRALHVTAFLLAGIGVIGLVMSPHAALHVRGSEWTISDTLHVVVTSVMVLSILLAVGFGAVTLGARFLRYSFGTLLVLVVSLTLIGVYAPRLAAHLPTPGLGIIERVNVYAYLLWVAVLAIGLLRHDRDRGANRDSALPVRSRAPTRHSRKEAPRSGSRRRRSLASRRGPTSRGERTMCSAYRHASRLAFSAPDRRSAGEGAARRHLSRARPARLGATGGD